MTNYIEIRLPYHRNVYVARICGRSKRYRFERDFEGATADMASVFAKTQ